MSRSISFLTVFVAAAILTLPAIAQDKEAGAKPVEAPATTKPGEQRNVFQGLKIELIDLDRLREEVDQKLVGEPTRMTVEECVQMALKNNQDILITGFDAPISDANLMAAHGDFDPSLSLSAKHADSATPASAQVKAFTQGGVQNIQSWQQDYQLSIGGKTWVGTQYSFGFDVSRSRGTFVRDATTGEKLSNYTANWTLTLTQPLLRGMGTKTNLVRIKLAKNNQKISDAQIQLTVIASVGEVIKSYWDLVGTVEQLKVRQRALDNALRVLRINEKRFELGTAAELEVFEAKAGVAARQSDLVSARAAVLNAEDVLKTKMGMRDESGELLSGANIIPTDRPLIHDPDYDLKKSMQTALDKRPDVLAAKLSIDNSELNKKATRNQLFPQLDISASFGRNTLQNKGIDIFEGLQNEDNRSWTIGVIASVPLGNRAARGNYQVSKLNVLQQEQMLRQTKDNAMLGVRTAIHALASNRILVESTKQARILEEANVDAEEQRLLIGVTTAQNVLLKQQDLTAAQASEVGAQVNFERSQVDLQVAEGTLLENMNIVYDSPDYSSAPGFFESIGKIDPDK